MTQGSDSPTPLNRVAGRGVGPSTQLHSSDILLSFDAVSARRSVDLMGRVEGIDVFRRRRAALRAGTTIALSLDIR